MPHKDPAKKRAYDAAYRVAHWEQRAASDAAYYATHKAEKAAYDAAHKVKRAEGKYRRRHADANRRQFASLLILMAGPQADTN